MKELYLFQVMTDSIVTSDDEKAAFIGDFELHDKFLKIFAYDENGQFTIIINNNNIKKITILLSHEDFIDDGMHTLSFLHHLANSRTITKIGLKRIVLFKKIYEEVYQK